MRPSTKLLLFGASDTAKMTATTVGAATLTLDAMTVAAGKTVIVNWGDGSTNTYTAGAGVRTHSYAGAGTWVFTITPATAITVLTLTDNKITLNSSDVKGMINILTFNVSALKAGTFNSADVSAWRPTDFRLYAMPSGYAGTFNSVNVSAWRPTIFLMRTMPVSYIFTMTAGGFSGWITTTTFNMTDNALTQAKVDQVLSDLWAAFATRTATVGAVTIGGTDSAPSGLLQAANPPTTGKEFAYELVNDSQNINPTKKWATVTITA